MLHRSQPSSEVEAEPPARPTVDLRPLVAASLTVHALLPPALWGLFVLSPQAAGWTWLGLHVVFPVVLLVTVRRGTGHWLRNL